MKAEIGAVQGRFQGLHLGHLEFLLEAKKRCEFLIVGITNHDIRSASISESASTNRFLSSANPFTYFERSQMIRAALKEVGIPLSEYCISPFPIESPEKIFNYLPTSAVCLQTIYDKWGEEKLCCLQDLGYQTEIMWRRNPSERFTSGTQVRKMMVENGDWQSLVPPSVRKYIIDNDLCSRVKSLQVAF